MRHRLTLGAIALLLGCGDALAPRTDVLTAGTHGSTLRLTNRSPATVYYAVAEREMWNLMDLHICDDPATCSSPQLAAGASVDVPYAQIPGYGPGAEGIVLHWHLVERAGEDRHVPDSIRRLAVILR